MSYSGKVVRWNSRGFGFVHCNDFDEDLFVHFSAFGGGDLIEGETLTFDVEDDPKNGKKRCTSVEGPAITRERPSGGRGDRGRDRYDSRDRGGGRDRYDSRDRRGGGRRYDSRDRGGGRDRYDSRDRRGGGRRYDSRDRYDRR
eukprot:TRINITY_DN1231_c0_g1_i2.p1 TRINITY_DN1231_c0_g1~~TRINITY_DN1231_c0_g1_i2.p1  ORF type:complete len:157 (+),score=39.29 TRINITY_DN1231_c0_g1_i2:45-473(+)